MGLPAPGKPRKRILAPNGPFSYLSPMSDHQTEAIPGSIPRSIPGSLPQARPRAPQRRRGSAVVSLRMTKAEARWFRSFLKNLTPKGSGLVSWLKTATAAGE